jgi:hypothetical protein
MGCVQPHRRRLPRPPRRTYLAVHEAGHAVAAHLLGLAVDFVSVLPDGGHVGGKPFSDTTLVVDAVVFTLAGKAATRRIVPDLHLQLDEPCDLAVILPVVRQAIAAMDLGLTACSSVSPSTGTSSLRSA